MPVPAGSDGYTDLYTDLPTVKAALGKLTVDDRDELIEADIRAACRLIDARCGRHFYRDRDASARTYRTAGRLAGSGTLLMIDDIATADGLLVESGSSAAWTSVPYTADLWPENSIERGTAAAALYATSWPYTQVRITAVWGWPEPPAQIVKAAVMMSARLYRRKDSPNGVLGSSEWGVTRVSRVDPDIERLIEPYVLPGFA